MAEAALRDRQTPAAVKPPNEPISIRRFELPDLSEHGGWILQRLVSVYPHLNDRTIWGWLNGMLNSNETLFLYQKHAVAVAQVVHGYSLAPVPVVHERFVFVQDPEDAAQVEQASAFYADFLRWAKALGAEAVLLSDLSDVPPDLAKGKVGGRLFEKKQLFVKVV